MIDLQVVSIHHAFRRAVLAQRLLSQPSSTLAHPCAATLSRRWVASANHFSSWSCLCRSCCHGGPFKKKPTEGSIREIAQWLTPLLPDQLNQHVNRPLNCNYQAHSQLQACWCTKLLCMPLGLLQLLERPINHGSVLGGATTVHGFGHFQMAVSANTRPRIPLNFPDKLVSQGDPCRLARRLPAVLLNQEVHCTLFMPLLDIFCNAIGFFHSTPCSESCRCTTNRSYCRKPVRYTRRHTVAPPAHSIREHHRLKSSTPPPRQLLQITPG